MVLLRLGDVVRHDAFGRSYGESDPDLTAGRAFSVRREIPEHCR
jgi:hypothetical protein